MYITIRFSIFFKCPFAGGTSINPFSEKPSKCINKKKSIQTAVTKKIESNLKKGISKRSEARYGS